MKPLPQGSSGKWFGTGAGAVYTCAYLPEFPAQALLRLRPCLRGKPVAVVEGSPPEERVCAGNALARRDGLLNGMTRVEVEAFGGMAVLRRSAQEESSAHTALLAVAGNFTPRVETCHTESAALCVLDSAGMGRLYSEPRLLAEALRRALGGRGFHACVAVSANFHAACALAQGGGLLTVVPPGEEQKALAPLLLKVLGIDAAQAQTLALWGIQTLGGLAALPQKELIARMGQSGKRLRELARGEHPHLFTPVPVPVEYREAYTFEAPVHRLDGVLFVLSPMLDQLVTQACAHALAIAAVTVTFALGSPEPDPELDAQPEPENKARAPVNSTHPSPFFIADKQSAWGASRALQPGGTCQPVPQTSAAAASPAGSYVRTVRATLPTQNKRLLLKLLQLDLAAHPPPAPVLAVFLNAQTARTGLVQGGLFAPPLPESSRLDVTLARLRRLVGEGRVGSPALRDTHAPDSFSMQTFASEAAPLLARSSGGKHAPALRQLRPPEPVHVDTEGGHPVRFWFRGELFHVCSACGPWRLSGAWWSQRAWSLESWDVTGEQVLLGGAPAQTAAVPTPASTPVQTPFQTPALHPFLIVKPAPHPLPRLCCCLQRDLQTQAWWMASVYD